MFTGIVRETGKIGRKDQFSGGVRFEIACGPIFPGLEVGHSVSIDGVCLTVIHKENHQGESVFQVDVTPETLRRSNLGSRQPGDRVNLEPAARLSDFMGGHLVQGHVDETGTVTEIRADGSSRIFRIQASPGVLRHCVLKGAITVNGVSLTLTALHKDSFEVAIIPHTLEVTDFSSLQVGDQVNLEADVISKYVETHVRHFLGIFVLAFLLSSAFLFANTFKLQANTVLVYQNLAGGQEAQFVVRLARYHPDVFLEWESKTHQGTLHLYTHAVREGKKFSFAQLFEVGVDVESEDVMSIWLSRRIYTNLMEDGVAKIEFNRLPLRLSVEREGTFRLAVNKQSIQVPMVQIKDDRNGIWTFHKDPDNPILLEYVSPYFRQYLKTVSNSSRNSLRWVRQLPPVK